MSEYVDKLADRIGVEIGESFYLSSQGMSEWPTLDECKHAGKRAVREVLEGVAILDELGFASWRLDRAIEPPEVRELAQRARDFVMCDARDGDYLCGLRRGHDGPHRTDLSKPSNQSTEISGDQGST